MIDSVIFKDFNFKLAVINELMYEREVLRPRFDVRRFVRDHTARQIDLEKEGYEIIPEVRAYFESLPILSAYLDDIEELHQDGGDEIYLQLCPLWDGEDDLFDIRSADDAALLPALKSVILLYSGDKDLLEQFRRRGVKADWR